MPSPRETYVAAVADCLRQIRRANGYNTDAGLYVTTEPAPRVDSDQAFIAVGWTSQRRPEDAAKRRTHRQTDIGVVAKIKAAAAESQAALDAIVADIERAMDGQQARFPVSYDYPQYVSAEPLGAAFGAGWVGVTLTYTGLIPIR